jgi:hypothetical protein
MVALTGGIRPLSAVYTIRMTGGFCPLFVIRPKRITTNDIQNPREVITRQQQRHLAPHLVKSPNQKMRPATPEFQGTKRMFHQPGTVNDQRVLAVHRPLPIVACGRPLVGLLAE